MKAVAVRAKSQIARPLSVLVPMILDEVKSGNTAGKEHFAKAGELLLEARESGQVAEFKWGKWLSENFALSRDTAYRYMRLAERIRENPNLVLTSIHMFEITQPEEHKKRKQRRAAFKLHKPVDFFSVEKQKKVEETRLMRLLAVELIDSGFKALATRLHSDHGGSDDAMRRLNHVRRVLKSVAQRMRFE